MRTEPFDAEFSYAWISDPQGGKALSLLEPELPFELVTHKLVDPMMADDIVHLRLQLRMFAEQPGVWRVMLMYRPDQAGQLVWTSELSTTAGWHDATLDRDAFGLARGKRLTTWGKAQKLIIRFTPEAALDRGEKACYPALSNVRFA